MASSDKGGDEQLLLEKYFETADIEVLGRLYEPYMPLVFGVCLKYFKDRDRSQDAVMEIFEKLIDSLLKHKVQNFKSWLHVTTRNYCLMELRKNRPEDYAIELSDTFMEIPGSLHPIDEPAIDERMDYLKDCLQQLKAEQQQCVSLFYLQKKSYQEIEKETEYPLKKVKSHIQNGKRNLKLCIEEKNEQSA